MIFIPISFIKCYKTRKKYLVLLSLKRFIRCYLVGNLSFQPPRNPSVIDSTSEAISIDSTIDNAFSVKLSHIFTLEIGKMM